MTGNTDVVVIGGGYAGVMAANRLTQRDDVTVTLINPRPTFVERLREGGRGYCIPPWGRSRTGLKRARRWRCGDRRSGCYRVRPGRRSLRGSSSRGCGPMRICRTGRRCCRSVAAPAVRPRDWPGGLRTGGSRRPTTTRTWWSGRASGSPSSASGCGSSAWTPPTCLPGRCVRSRRGGPCLAPRR